MIDHGIIIGKIEYDDIVQLHFPEARQAPVFPLYGIRIGLAAQEAVMHQRDGQRRLRQTRPVGQLAHKQVIVHQQRIFHRPRGYGIGFY